MFAFIAFLVAAFIFLLRAFSVNIDADWGFVVLAVGLALLALPGDLLARRP